MTAVERSIRRKRQTTRLMAIRPYELRAKVKTPAQYCCKVRLVNSLAGARRPERGYRDVRLDLPRQWTWMLESINAARAGV
ncbi:hypothetical protein EVAR_45730_1 [Eumeta japonica]|uniref:Uncharacterized protein n=1 Tax=Eumeta variegata TaxID=151549 RepID=A0A4C1WZ79_EUMVA|nr:hypothetical protein EVAR_45730_1 [Eumeta japonica]